jgi:hypothetical protein
MHRNLGAKSKTILQNTSSATDVVLKWGGGGASAINYGVLKLTRLNCWQTPGGDNHRRSDYDENLLLTQSHILSDIYWQSIVHEVAPLNHLVLRIEIM